MRDLSASRRRFLAASAAALVLSNAPATAAAPAACDLGDGFRRPKFRLALLMGNSSYPKGTDPTGDDLPSAKKNLDDLCALLRDGFAYDVTVGHNQGLGEMRQQVAAFVARAKSIVQTAGFADGDLSTLIYFCGHGLQQKGVNLLVPAHVDQRQERMDEKCLSLQGDILTKLPSRASNYPGVNIVLIDACRAGGDVKESFAQFASVQGCIATIGSSSGGYAFFPRAGNSWFTRAILEVFEEERRNPLRATSIEELMTLAEKQCEAISKAEFFDEENRERKARGLEPWIPQRPESTKNLRDPAFVLQNIAATCEGLKRKRSEEQLAGRAKEKARLDLILAEIYPRVIARKCAEFIKDFPSSDFGPTVRARQFGAEKTQQALKLVRNLAVDTLVAPDPSGDAIYREDLTKASARGDKDAAQRVAWMYRDGTNGLAKNELRLQDFLRLSAELGNGIASFEVFELMRRTGDPDARYFLTRAKDLGYPVPKDLPESR